MEQMQSNPNLKYVLAGSMCLMMALASHGLAISTIQYPMLTRLNGAGWFTTLTVLNSIAICVMTPVGGRLTGMIGAGKVMKLFGTGAILFALGMAFLPNLYTYLLCSVLLSICQGAYASIPYVVINMNLPRNESPKYIGYLTMIAAIGAPLGSYASGFFMDHDLPGLALSFPVLFILPAVLLIAKFARKSTGIPFVLDWVGIALLAVTLAGLLMGLNNGPVAGWFSRMVMTSFFVGAAGLCAFIYWENKTPNPIIPLHIFTNKMFFLVIFAGFLFNFYMPALNAYMPQAVQNVMGASSSVSGAIQLPRSLMMLLCPALASAWVIKKTDNIWKALAIAGGLLCIAYGLLVFTGPHMPLWFLLCVIGLTGIAETFRSIGLMPAVQRSLDAKDMAVGTSLVGFVLTLSGSVSSALYGLAYNTLTAQTPGIRGMTDGIDTICLMVSFLSFVGMLVVVLFVRPLLDKRAQSEQS